MTSITASSTPPPRPPRPQRRRRADSVSSIPAPLPLSLSSSSSPAHSASASVSASPAPTSAPRRRPRPVSLLPIPTSAAGDRRSLGLGHAKWSLSNLSLLDPVSPPPRTSSLAGTSGTGTGMADPRTPASTRVPSRRKASSVDRERPYAAGAPGSASASAVSVAHGPRLKARVNVAEIVDPGSVGIGPPRLRKTPSSLSGGDSNSNLSSQQSSTPTLYGRPRSPVSTSSRSSVGVGPATPSSSSTIGMATKPRVAKAAQTARSGASTPGSGATSVSVPASVTSTPTFRRPPSVIGTPAGSSTAIPTRSPPQRRSPTSSAVGSSRPTSAAMASMGSRFKTALAGNQSEPSPSAAPATSPPAATHVTPPVTRVHVRAPSTKLSISAAAGTRHPVTTALGMDDPYAGVGGRPTTAAAAAAASAAAAAAASAPAARDPYAADRPPLSAGHSPLNPLHSPSTLMEVTPEWANQTMNETSATGLQLPPPPTSSSLLSPSTLIPSLMPPTPPQFGFEGEHPSPFVAAFGSATLTTADAEPNLSSNHSSPVRPTVPLEGPSPLRAQFPRLSVQPHPTASCPSSPTPGDSPLASNVTTRRASRAPLPWNPHSTPLTLSAAPDSPELRTVALPAMTPTRSPDSAEDYIANHAPDVTIVARVRGMPNGANGSMRRYSSFSTGSDDYGSSPHSGTDTPLRSGDRLSGSTIADDSEAELGDKHDAADVFSDEEKAKVERKIADLEISNASLMAINRSLEATKAKQRSEILRLKRMLRESQSGLVRAAADATPIPGVAPAPLSRVASTDDEGGGWGDDEMDDPELEARWDRLASLVGTMRKRGEDAVERGKEETKPAMQRVLGWLEVEAMDTGASPSEIGDGEGETPDRARNLRVGSISSSMIEDDVYHTDHTDVTYSTNVSAASNATQLGGEVLPRGQRF